MSETTTGPTPDVEPGVGPGADTRTDADGWANGGAHSQLPSVNALSRRFPVLRMFLAARPVGWRLLLAGVLGALALGSSVGLIATSGFLISKAALQPPILHLQVAIVCVRAFGIGRGVFRYAERIVGHDAAFRSLSDLRVAVYERLRVVSPSAPQGWSRGDLLNRLVSDVDATVNLHLRVALPYLAAVLVGTGSVLLMAAFVPVAGLAMAGALLIGGLLVPLLTLRLARRSQRLVAPAAGRLSSEVVTLVHHHDELVALGQTPDVLDRIRGTDAELTDASRVAARSSGVGSALGVLAQGGALVAALVAGTQAVTAETLDGINLALVVLIPLAAYEAVQVLPAAVLSLAQVAGSARRISEVLDAPDPVPDPTDPIDSPGADTASAAPLRVRGLSAGWAPGEYVVRDLDLDVSPGSPVALIAPSGAGKSTVAAALARMAPSTGQVEWAGVDLTRLTGSAVRDVVGLSPQDGHVFDTSIAQNVHMANRSASDEDVMAALDAVGLSQWIEQLPQGVDTELGTGGRRLSGGQRQRLMVARVLVAHHPVVIADEPTEHLDTAAAAQVMDALVTHCRDRCLLVVSHRPADAQWCDRVVRLP